jgi:hypothetical protein
MVMVLTTASGEPVSPLVIGGGTPEFQTEPGLVQRAFHDCKVNAFFWPPLGHDVSARAIASDDTLRQRLFLAGASLGGTRVPGNEGEYKRFSGRTASKV